MTTPSAAPQKQLIPNTFGIKVHASRMLTINHADDLEGLTFDPLPLIVGAGSDMVFTRDYPGTVLRLADRSEARVLPDGTVEAWGGMKFDDLVQWTLDRGLYGLENLSAIPGTVGASVVQNVGAYGAEAAQFVASVETVDLTTAQRRTYSAAECRFGYRTSRFKAEPNRELVVRVCFKLGNTFVPNLGYKALENMPHANAGQLREAIAELRWGKLPRPEVHGSAGSFFKNPIADSATVERLLQQYPDMPVYPGGKLAAGWLIERAGWKGRTLGRAGVWPKQALVLYNTGGCTGAEVVELAQAIVADVQKQFGITLSPEAIII
ncbi:MAG: UDP-N-acetylmuramate dehydrogenase [Bacteroidales bacterium]|nr:UDP-N-acetylmuramate dehydrogenase [Bacteroidales bacterium]